MKHPVLANWIKFEEADNGEYIVKDLLLDEEFSMDEYSVWFARQLNGRRNPYKIDKRISKDDVELLLAALEAQNVIRDNRFLVKQFLSLFVTVWRPQITEKLRMVSFIINGLLLISWLPLLVFSVYYFINNFDDISTDYITLGTFAGIFVGIVMHELGHMFACLAYGGRVFEVGVMMQFLLPGAYVLLNQSNIRRRMRRIQVSAAGIEMNLLLTGIFIILAARFEALSGFFLGATIQNLFLALLNLTFVNGFDGMTIMGELLGVDSVVEKAKKITAGRLSKKRLQEKGMAGNVTIAVCYALRVIQIALPLVVAVNIVGVISWFL